MIQKRLLFLFLLLPVLAGAQQSIPGFNPSQGQIDMLRYMTQATSDLLNGSGDLFIAPAARALRYVGALMIVLIGIGIAWDSAGGRVDLTFPNLRQFAFFYMVAQVCITNWTAYRHLFSDASQIMVAMVDFDTLTRLGVMIDAVNQKIYTPSFLDPTSYIPYYAILGTLSCLSGLMSVVSMYGLIVLAVGGVIGPLFMMTLAFGRHWSGYAWGWIHATIKYGLYGVFGACFVNVVATFVMSFLTNAVRGVYTADHLEALLGAFIEMAVVVVFTLWRIPAVITDYTSGGASSGHGLGSAMAAGFSRLTARIL